MSLTAPPRAWESRRPLIPELALIAATIAYGSTFKIVKDALEHVTPVGFILLRFTIGSIVLLPFALRRGWHSREYAEPTRGGEFFQAALLFGVVGFVGYWFQNAGLQHTSTSNSAFITGLFVVFTPLVETIARRRAPARNVIVAVVLAALGLFLLTGAKPTLGKGDALTLGCAACFGVWIYLGGVYSQRFDPVALTTVQMIVFAVLAIPFVLIGGLGHINAGVIAAAVITGVLCSAVAFSLQLWGQRYVEPSRAAVILLFEPVVAGIVGYAVGERLGIHGYLGAAIILAGMVVAEWRVWATAAREGASLRRK